MVKMENKWKIFGVGIVIALLFVMAISSIATKPAVNDAAEKIWMPDNPILMLAQETEFTNAVQTASKVVISQTIQNQNFSAIFVDSQWRNSLSSNERRSVDTWMISAMQNGTPIIAYGDNATFLSNLILHLNRDSGNKLGVSIPQFEVTINSYLYHDDKDVGHQHFVSTDLKEHPTSSAKEIIEWIKNAKKKTLEKITTSTGSWSPTYTWSWYSYDDWEPRGRFNIWCEVFKLQNDGSSTYDWFNIKAHLQTIGGYSKYDSNWRTADTYANHDVHWNPASYIQDIVDYDPTTTPGVGTYTVNIGVTAGQMGAQITASQEWSYSISDVPVIDQGDVSEGLVSWWHDIAEDKNVGKYTYHAKPGYTLRNYPFISRDEVCIYNDYKVKFMRPWIWGYWESWTSPLKTFYTYFYG